VVGSEGSFLLQVEDFASFSQAMQQKLLNEIAGLHPQSRTAGREARPFWSQQSFNQMQ